MVLAVQAMEDQGQEAAVAAGVVAAATTAAVATPHGAAEDPRSTLLAIAVLALGPKPLQCHLSGEPFDGAVDPFVLQSLHITIYVLGSSFFFMRHMSNECCLPVLFSSNPPLVFF